LGGAVLSASDRADDPRTFVVFHGTTPGYFAAMGIPIRSGRTFTPDDDLPDRHVVIVSSSVAHALWPTGPVVGRQIVLPAAPGVANGVERFTVVGVIGDLRLGTRPIPDVFLPLAHTPSYWVDVIVRTSSDAKALAVPIHRALRELSSDLLIENES